MNDNNNIQLGKANVAMVDPGLKEHNNVEVLIYQNGWIRIYEEGNKYYYPPNMIRYVEWKQ